MSAPAGRSRSGAAAVAAGIALSRVFGLVRQRVIGHYLGVGDAADVISAALRIPNVLQNLLGEGVLSASFVPVYARLRAEGRDEDAARLALGVGATLAAVCAVLVLAGISFSPQLVGVIAGGFPAGKQAFAVDVVRILFPGVGALVMSAWCLGVLNAHRRFFLSYAAPVAWNVAIIAALVARANTADPDGAARLVAWGAVIGSAAQFIVQLPSTMRLIAPGIGPAKPSPEMLTVFRNFGPAFVGRGVVQLSAWVDQIIASHAIAGSAAVLLYAQNIALLPVSVFGMSVAVSELTEMSSRAVGEVEGVVRARLDVGLRRVAFFVVPSSAALLILGDVIASAVLETGRFTHADATWVWAVLAGSAVGLLAGTLGRLYSSGWYALQNTRTPVKFAIVRLALTAGLGAPAALLLPSALGIEPKWGMAGLTATAGIAGWVEFALLRRSLNARVGDTGLPATLVARLWGAALVAAAIAIGVKLLVASLAPVVAGGIVLGTFGLLYIAITQMLGVREAHDLTARIRGFGAGTR